MMRLQLKYIHAIMKFHRSIIPPVMVGIVIMGALSCVAPDRTPLSFLDTSEHHTYTGMVLLKQDKFSDAEREFSLALRLNKKSALGHAGMAMINANRGDFGKAFECLDKAAELVRRDRERLFVHISKLRLYTMSRYQDDWMSRAEGEFVKALAVDPRSSAAYYFMGLARMANHEFQKAGMLFIRVLDLDDEYLDHADREWKRVKKILIVNPSSELVEEVALAERVTRGQAALLLIEELRLDDLYRGLGIYVGSSAQAQEITDIKNHRYVREIERIVEIGVEGLNLYPDGKFYPNDIVTRLNLAVALHDVLVRVLGRGEDVYDYGDDSPFFDSIDCDHPYRKAVMAVTSRDIMSPEMFAESRLAPYSPMSGADALMAIHNLRGALLIGF
ncbi:MAG: hypothetical protein PHU03_00385 [Syntrophales bacterium]|nr:hypothetical protein [Syntrophales bacterium]